MGREQIAHKKLGEINLHRRRGVKRLLVRVDAGGSVHLTLPWWVSKAAGLAFLSKNEQWLTNQKSQHSLTVRTAMIVGTDLELDITDGSSDRYYSKYRQGKLIVKIPKNAVVTDSLTQTKLKKIITKELKIQAEARLLPRLRHLADESGYTYKSSSVKTLKSRWGSCSSDKDIVINTYLVQLPQRLIDYVLLHELAHTKHLHHGSGFWDELQLSYPDAKICKKLLKQYHPRIYERGDINTLVA